MEGILGIIIFNLVSSLNSLETPYEEQAAGCQINIRQLPLNTPLLLNSSSRTIIYPDYGGSIINLRERENIELDCPGAGLLQIGAITTNEITIVTCISGSNFEIHGQIFDINRILCSRRITSVAQFTGATCWAIGREIEAGLVLQDGSFLQQYTSCFDEVLRNVIYTKFNLTKQIGFQITGGTTPSWSEDDFYNLGVRLNNIFPIVAHRATINRQLGLEPTDQRFVRSTGHLFIARGHLTARTDFMFNAQQMSTYHYINSAPQWQTFNANNWFFFERNLRNYAAANFVDLEVYTGTYGITTLPHQSTGADVELFLFIDENIRALPVPELFWKIVYDPLNKAGVVVLGINNPYQTNVTKSVICEDVADELTWLTFDRFRLDRGYIYACTLSNFRNIIPYIPKFDVRHLLY